MTTETTTGVRCCGSCVGVLIESQAGELLMVTRGWYPEGVAPVAGHRDIRNPVATEVREETGLTVVGTPELVWRGRLDNLCQSPPANPPGHYWFIYRAAVVGELSPDPVETRGARWYSRAEVQELADRTIAYASGALTDAEFAADPGLEPVWVEHLERLDMIRVGEGALDGMRRIYTTPPAEYWLG